MLPILFVLVFGTSVNALNAGAHDLPSFEASVVQQVQHPVISKADPSKYNQ